MNSLLQSATYVFWREYWGIVSALFLVAFVFSGYTSAASTSLLFLSFYAERMKSATRGRGSWLADVWLSRLQGALFASAIFVLFV